VFTGCGGALQEFDGISEVSDLKYTWGIPNDPNQSLLAH